MIVDAGQPERCTAYFEPRTFVDEHANTGLAETADDELGCRPVIVVPEAGVRAEFGLEPPEHFGDGGDVTLLVRNVIARQHEHVRLEPVRDLDRAFDVFEPRERAVMN